MQPIRVYIIHRLQVLVDVLSESMEERPEILLVGVATGAQEVLGALGSQEVDVLLVDRALFGSIVRSHIHEFKRSWPGLKIVPLGLVTHDQIIECIEAGANGYIAEDASFDQLVETIRGVYFNQAPCSSQVAASVSARLAQLSTENDGQAVVRLPDDVTLTPKEKQVLRLAANGLSNKEIASRLGITLSTVKFHIHKILGKLQVRKRREAIQLAFEIGLLRD